MSNFKNIQCKKYFLYRHIRLDKNVPFYIGIGVNNRRTTRTRYHERAYKIDSRSEWWLKIVNKTDYEVEIIYQTDDEVEIRRKEREFIALYGRRDTGTGTLVNLTDGGDGALNVSENTRKKLSAQKIGNKNGLGAVRSEATKILDSERMKGKQYFKGKSHTNETKDLIKKSMANIPLAESHRSALVGTHPNSKKVFCYNTNKVYESIGECIRIIFKCKELAKHSHYRKYKHGISKVCNNKLPSYKGFIFKFI